MKYFFIANFDCLVRCENNSIVLKKNEKNEMIFDNSHYFLEILPLNKKNDDELIFSYIAEFETENNNLICKNSLVEITKIENDFYQIVFKKNIVNLSDNILFDDFVNEKIKIISDFYTKIFYNEKLIYENNNVFYSAQTYSLNENYYAIQLTNKTENLLLIFEHKKLLFEDDVNKFEKTENGFQTLKVFSDISKQGIVKKYNVELEKLSLSEEYAVYLQKENKLIYSKVCSPIAFLECVKASNIVLAKQFLNSELKKASITHFKKFFGDFEKILILPNQNINLADANKNLNLYLTYKKTENCFYCKKFVFTLFDDKITNIDC